ncbi:AEC family transporter [Georgenia sp. Z1344]|uniref:AEC family transporter n=1 Tax=Georgenia sp. Z1344 TaxID=3416706 RepID=UPI003CEDA8A6
MQHVLAATVPVFLVVALGYVLTRIGMFRREDASVLSRFVVKVALPLLIFANLAGRSPAEVFHAAYLLTYALAALVMFGLAALYGRARGRDRVRTVFMGTGMAGTNNGFIGFPVFLLLFTEQAGAAVGMGMIVDNALIIPLTLLLAERATGTGTVRDRLVATVRGVLLHPMVVAIVAALALSAAGLEVPSALGNGVDLLAGASTGVALFAVGGMFVGLRIRGALGDVLATVVGKLAVMPAIAVGLLLAFDAAGLPSLPDELRAAAVLMCALPTYSVLPALAEQYGETDVPTATMMLQTACSFLTLTGWMLALSAAGWM